MLATHDTYRVMTTNDMAARFWRARARAFGGGREDGRAPCSQRWPRAGVPAPCARGRAVSRVL